MSEQKLFKRYQQAKTDWENWRSLYDEAYAYAIPNKDPWPTQLVQGTRKNTQVFDITANNSTRRLVSKLHSSLVPPGQQWFGLEAGEEVLDPSKKKELNFFLQKFTDIIFQSLNASNFDLAINEFLQDIVVGTGGLMILESQEAGKHLKFKSVSVDMIYPEANAYDEIKTVWRDFKDIPGQDIKLLWPKAKLTSTIQQRIDKDPLIKMCFIEGVIFDPDTSIYRVVVLEQESNDAILDLRSPSTPWVVARWSKASSEVGGRGPIIEALPTIRSLNVLVEEIMRNAALSTSPPWMAASDGVFNPYLFEIAPNKVIPISRQSLGESPLQRLDVATDINLATLEINDLRTQIKDALFDQPVRPPNAPPITATQVMVEQQQFLEDIGPAFGRLSVELLPPIINRCIFILQKKGLLPPDLKVDGKQVKIQYKSPLVRSAEVQKIQNLSAYVEVLQPIMGQELTLATLNLEAIPGWLSSALDVDETLVKSPAQLLELKEQVQQSMSPPQEGSELPAPNQAVADEAIQQPAG